jgi:hypothetical protein
MTNERTQRNKANRMLAALPSYHNAIPNADIDNILSATGFSQLAEGIYCGRDGQVHEQVGPNTWLHLTWHKMEETGRYEIVAYVS